MFVMGPFEVFNPQAATSGRGVPVIYALSAGRLILNAAATRLVGDTDWVQLLWDAETKRIGLRPVEQGDLHAVRIVRSPSQSVITSKPFVDEHNLAAKKQRMRLAWDGQAWVASTVDPATPIP